MKNVINIAVVVGAMALGGGGGYFIKRQRLFEAKNDLGAEQVSDSYTDQLEGKRAGGSRAPSDSGATSSTAPMHEVFEFKRPFIVPVLKNGDPKFMIILDIDVEYSGNSGKDAYKVESLLRDVLLGRLFELAADDLLGSLTEEPAARSSVKKSLTKAAQSVLGEGVEDVLIKNIGVQKY